MAGDALLTADEFERVSLLHCRRWAARSLLAVRALLVERKRMTDVAEQFGMKPQQVDVLRNRFLEKIRRGVAVKLPAEQYMGTVAPATLSVLSPFAADITSESEVEECHVAGSRHQNVGRLHVAVSKTVIVQRGERFRRLPRDP